MSSSLASQTKSLWPQWVGSLAAFLELFVLGIMMGWTSPYLAQLQAADSPLPITELEASWVASLVNLGRLPGAILGALGVQYIGCKKTLLFSSIPPALGWICLIIANSAPWLYAARIFAGIGFGACMCSFPMYLGEISVPSIRGALVSLAMNALPLGTLVGNIMGAYVSMMVFAIIALIPNIITVLLFVYLPDSPHYLVKIGNIPGSEKSISWYNRGVDVKAELAQIEKFVHAKPALSWKQWFKELALPQNRKGMILIIFLFLFMQLNGVVAISFYLEIIITNAGVTVIDPALLVIVLAAVSIAMGWVAVFLVDVCGRKLLLAISCAGGAFAMITLGIHYILIGSEYDPTELQWLAIFAISLFRIFPCIGIVPVPNTILSELFASNTKSIAALLSSMISAIFGFIVTLTYQLLVNAITEAYTYFLYAAVLIISVLFTVFFVPETKGKSLQEIQDMLSKENKKDEQSIHC